MNRHTLNSRDNSSSRPEECPRNYSKETTDQTSITSGKAPKPVSPTTNFQLPQPPMNRGGRFQEENLLDLKPPAVPHFLHQDDLNKAADVALEDNFDNDMIAHDNDSVDVSLAYQPTAAHDESNNYESNDCYDIETAVGGTREPPTTTQARLRPGAFRVGGGFQDDEETLQAVPEQNPVPPSQPSTQDNVVAEAELVGDDPRLVVANVAQEDWWTKPRNVRILVVSIVLLLVLILIVLVVNTVLGGAPSHPPAPGFDNDICEDAILLPIPSSIEGSTMNATVDDVGADTPCEPNAAGIWYTVGGTDSNIIASTCNNDTSYDTAISVFRGGCKSLQCVVNDDDLGSCNSSSRFQGSSAIWTSVRGENYSVLVHGASRSAMGYFRLDINHVDVNNDV